MLSGALLTYFTQFICYLIFIIILLLFYKLSMNNKNLSENEDFQTLSYEDKILFAFVGKKKKNAWYKRTFKKYNMNGVEGISWSWSWYAFLFSGFFLIYRKLYFEAIIYFICLLLLPWKADLFSQIFFFIIHLLFSGTIQYLIYRRFSKLKNSIEEKISKDDERIMIMNSFGGVNAVLPLSIIFIIVSIFWILINIIS
jgi:hypothetical protein